MTSPWSRVSPAGWLGQNEMRAFDVLPERFPGQTDPQNFGALAWSGREYAVRGQNALFRAPRVAA